MKRQKPATPPKPAPTIILAPVSTKHSTGTQGLWGKGKAKNP